MALQRSSSTVVEITAVTVRSGDVITIGGQHFKVIRLTELPGRAKRLGFATGETLTLHPRTRLYASRIAEGR